MMFGERKKKVRLPERPALSEHIGSESPADEVCIKALVPFTILIPLPVPVLYSPHIPLWRPACINPESTNSRVN